MSTTAATEQATDAATAVASPARPTASIMDRTVCIAIERSRFGNSCKVSKQFVATTADKALVSLSKRLLVSDELKAITALDRKAAKFLAAICLPSMFRNGVYLIPIPLVEMVEKFLGEFVVERRAAVDTFVEAYPALISAVEAKLGDMFDANDYPTSADLRESFSFEWQYVSFGVPGSLASIRAGLFEAEREKHARKLQEAVDACRQALRGEFAEAVKHMSERLKPGEDGKRKVFKAASVERLQSFIAMFDVRNVADYDDLAKLVDQARALTVGMDPELLRSDDLVRERIAEGLANITASLETMGVDRHTRAIDLGDE